MDFVTAEPTTPQRPEVTVVDGFVIIKAKIDPKNSAKGKSILLASFSGDLPLQVDGKQVKLGLNLYTRK